MDTSPRAPQPDSPPPSPASATDQQEAALPARSVSPTPSASSLRSPTASGAVVRTISAAQSEIVGALNNGGFAHMQSVLEQAAAMHRVPAVLNGAANGAGAPTYARVLDSLRASPDDAEAHALVPKFGADLLRAAIENDDVPRLKLACNLFAASLPQLVAQDEAHAFQSAALRPAAMEVLLDHVPSTHWGDLLAANGGAPMAYLWRNAVRKKPVPSAAERDRAFALLNRVFSNDGVSALQLNQLHHSSREVQRFMMVGKRSFPAPLRALAACFEARGGVVPWGTA